MRRVDAFSSTLQEDFVLAEYEAMMNVPSTTNRIGDNVDFIDAYFEHALFAIAESGIFEVGARSRLRHFNIPLRFLVSLEDPLSCMQSA